MTVGPYLNSYLPVSRASDALRNQADTILSELHASIDRAKAFRAKLAARAEDRGTHLQEAVDLQRQTLTREYGQTPFLVSVRWEDAIPCLEWRF